jgi:hypothetical protein
MIFRVPVKQVCQAHMRRAAVTIMAVSAVFCTPCIAAPHSLAADRMSRISADVCASNPKLFKLRPLTLYDSLGLAQLGVGLPIVFQEGTVISGPCTRFIKSFGGLVTLTNNYQFVISNSALVPVPAASPGSGPQPVRFTPPKNVMTIASDEFAEGGGRRYVQSIGFNGQYTALWSGPKGSAIGTIRCAREDNSRCALERLILSSRYRIHKFGFIPSPHPEMHFGSLWFWVTARPGEEVIVGYAVNYSDLNSPGELRNYSDGVP